MGLFDELKETARETHKAAKDYQRSGIYTKRKPGKKKRKKGRRVVVYVR